MATIKYIIKRQVKNNGKHAVYLRLTHKRKPTTLKTSIDVYKDEWVAETGRVKKIKNGSENIARLNHKLNKFETKVTDIIYKLEDEDKLNDLTVTELRNIILGKKVDVTLFTYWQNYIDKKVSKLNTKKAHINGLSSFKRFRKDKDIKFEAITVAFLNDYENWNLQKGNKYNGFATNLNMLKRIFNLAINEALVSADYYPFGGRKFKVKKSTPKKKAIINEEVERIKNIELVDAKLIEAKKLFLISYYMGGIAFVDLCKLKYRNISKGYISYHRTKTGVEATIAICDELRTLLDGYLKPNAKNTDYIFGFISNDKFTKEDLEYKRAWQNYNNSLKKLGKVCGIKTELTTYVARHTFATVGLNDLNLPIGFVKKALAHKNIAMTNTYVDDYNKKLMPELVSRL